MDFVPAERRERHLQHQLVERRLVGDVDDSETAAAGEEPELLELLGVPLGPAQRFLKDLRKRLRRDRMGGSCDDKSAHEMTPLSSREQVPRLYSADPSVGKRIAGRRVISSPTLVGVRNHE